MITQSDTYKGGMAAPVLMATWDKDVTMTNSCALVVTCRDGYTDLRGRFDYVTLTSTADMSSVVRYSLLVASRGHGAVMLQAAPPPK
jgi:hypothetical protein